MLKLAGIVIVPIQQLSLWVKLHFMRNIEAKEYRGPRLHLQEKIRSNRTGVFNLSYTDGPLGNFKKLLFPPARWGIFHLPPTRWKRLVSGGKRQKVLKVSYIYIQPEKLKKFLDQKFICYFSIFGGWGVGILVPVLL